MYRDCSPDKPQQNSTTVYYHHFMLNCQMSSYTSYVIWITHHTGCVVFQKTKEEEYECYFNVLGEKGSTSVKFSASFNPVFAQKIYYSKYNIQLYTAQGIFITRYDAFQNTRDINALQSNEWNCTKILIYEYESTASIQTMFYQIKLGVQHLFYPHYTLSKNVTQLQSAAPLAFVRMLIDVSAPFLILLVRVTNIFKDKPNNIYYISFSVAQCQKNSSGLLLVLTAKEVYENIVWYRDTYTFLAPATVLPVVKVPHQYLDINMYYLNTQPTSCVVNIDYRYNLLPMDEDNHLAPVEKGSCTFVVSNLLKLSCLLSCCFTIII